MTIAEDHGATAWLMLSGVDGADDVLWVADLIRKPAWMSDAACRGEPTATFIPERGGNAASSRVICAGCSVRDECLAYALADSELEGFWAGTTTKERQRMRKQGRAAQSAGIESRRTSR